MADSLKQVRADLTPRIESLEKALAGLNGSPAGVAALERIAAALEGGGSPPPVTPPQTWPASALPSFKGLDIMGSLWQWEAPFFPLAWGPEPQMAPAVWKAENLRLGPGGELIISVTDAAAGGLKAGNKSKYLKALFEADVTFGPEVPGLVQAPLWLYNDDTADEIDFELVGAAGGLQIATHSGTQFDQSKDKNGVALPATVLPAGQAGKRMKLGIEYHAGDKAVLYIDGKEVARRTASQYAPGVFPKSPLGAIFNSWPTNASDPNLTNWTGVWKGTQGKVLETIIHGYRVTPL